jgi:uncharacterized repeat protein (TIGR03803 family)
VTTLHSFNGADGTNPYGILTFGSDGTLYGTTLAGGAFDDGTVFAMTPSAGGGFTFNTIHSFTGNDTDGLAPAWSIVQGSDGTLYGTALGGEFHNGMVFSLKPAGSGGFTFNTIYSFPDSTNRIGALVMGGGGTLYGGTAKGSIFRLTPDGRGGFDYQEIYFLNPDQDLGRVEMSLSPTGTLYGTTFLGGAFGGGSVFSLTPDGNGFAFKDLHSFNGITDGIGVLGRPLIGSDGTLYSVTQEGGPANHGTVFSLTPDASGDFVYKTVYNFQGGTDNGGPLGPLTMDADGVLYGTTADGFGTAFDLTPGAGGRYAFHTIHTFEAGEGVIPVSALTVGEGGVLYGTTAFGGENPEFGTVIALAHSAPEPSSGALALFPLGAVAIAGRKRRSYRLFRSLCPGWRRPRGAKHK